MIQNWGEHLPESLRLLLQRFETLANFHVFARMRAFDTIQISLVAESCHVFAGRHPVNAGQRS